MSRYIDAVQLENKLIEHKKDEHSNLNKCGYDTWRNAFKIALRELHNTPTANVKEVIYCKNCKYFKTDTEYCEEHNKGYCEFDNTIKSRNHFCGYADRKEVENTCEVEK